MALQAFTVLLHNYPYHSLLWNLYSVHPSLRMLKPSLSNFDHAVSVIRIPDICMPFDVFLLEPSVCCDGFYIDSDANTCVVKVRQAWFYVPIEWVTRLYSYCDSPASHEFTLFHTNCMRWRVAAVPFCCRENIIVKDRPIVITKQCVCVDQSIRIFPQLYHLGKAHCLAGKREYVNLYNCGLLFGWHCIKEYLETSRGFCGDCIIFYSRLICRVLKVKDTLCEFVAHVILCKYCYGEFFGDVMQKIIGMDDVEFRYDVDDEHFDKVFDYNINKLVARRECRDVRNFAGSGRYFRKSRFLDEID